MFGKNRLATAAALAIVAIVAVAAAAPYLPLADPDAVDTPNRLRPPFTPGHLLGTDEFGRDLLSRLIWGGRVSLLAGVGAAGAAMLVGVGLGVVAGYAGDPTNAPEWYANIKSVEWRTQPPVIVGSRMDFVAQFLGRRLAYTYEVAETKVTQVMDFARKHQHPLQCVMEKK